MTLKFQVHSQTAANTKYLKCSSQSPADNLLKWNTEQWVKGEHIPCLSLILRSTSTLLHPCNFCIFLQKLLPCLSVPAESADPAVPSSAHRSGLTGWQPEQNSHSPNSSSTSPLPFANTPVILQPFLTVHVSLQLQLPKVGENASSVFAERSLN